MTPAKSFNKTKGRFAELHAAAYLCRNGCELLARNYRYRNGELDIIARDPKGTILFVEVKSIWNNNSGSAESRVGFKKQIHVWRTAVHFLHHHGGQEQKSRFDVICVNMCHGTPSLFHYPDAFSATRVIPEC